MYKKINLPLEKVYVILEMDEDKYIRQPFREFFSAQTSLYPEEGLYGELPPMAAEYRGNEKRVSIPLSQVIVEFLDSNKRLAFFYLDDIVEEGFPCEADGVKYLSPQRAIYIKHYKES